MEQWSVDYVLFRWKPPLTGADHLRSTSHRVTLPPLSDRFEGEQRVTRKRFSIPYFLAPDPDSIIECIPSCMGADEPSKYEPITQAGYNQMRASMQY
jgi:isopenicillin N synthase-like dioxygenase